MKKRTLLLSLISVIIPFGPKTIFCLSCSGPEAKAAWLLRRDVIEYLLQLIAATVKIQRNVKWYLLSKKLQRIMAARRHGVGIIQRTARRYFAYNQARLLRRQRVSLWEQLWHSTYNALYYYNYYTGESSYNEPDPSESYRPLVRHPISAQLMQAWPDLDAERKAYYQGTDPMQMLLLENGSGQDGNQGRELILPPSALCRVCDTRVCVKLCLDCNELARRPSSPYDIKPSHQQQQQLQLQLPVTKPTSYCLTCFAKAHPEDDSTLAGHRVVLLDPLLASSNALLENTASTAQDTDGGTSKTKTPEEEGDGGAFLVCCMCNEAATRKCRGLYSDTYVDAVCERLKRATLANWREAILFNPSDTSKDEDKDDQQPPYGESKSHASPEKKKNSHLLPVDVRGTGGEDKSKLISLIEDVLKQAEGSGNSTGGNDANRSPARLSGMATSMIYGPGHDDDENDSKYTVLSPVQLQSIRSLFTKLRSECDECYCANCYDTVHAKGKRALHIWQGFQAKVEVCGVCQASPVETACSDCVCNYCEPCYRVFHSKGQKRKHKHQVCREKPRHKKKDVYCEVCTYRIGQGCSRESCKVVVCAECFEFRHRMTMSCQATKREHYDLLAAEQQRKQQYLEQLQQQQQQQEEAEAGGGQHRGKGSPQHSSPPGRTATAPGGRSKSPGGGATSSSSPSKAAVAPAPPPPCTICGEDADKICVECGDFYCSRTWMGNPGCFVQVHSRGNRATHTTEPWQKAKLILFQKQQMLKEQQQQKEAMSRVTTATLGKR